MQETTDLHVLVLQLLNTAAVGAAITYSACTAGIVACTAATTASAT